MSDERKKYDAFVTEAARQLAGVGYHVTLALRPFSWRPEMAWQMTIYMQKSRASVFFDPGLVEHGEGPRLVDQVKRLLRLELEKELR